jgi:hypothetical protein
MVADSKPGARRIANGDAFSPEASALTGGREEIEGAEPIGWSVKKWRAGWSGQEMEISKREMGGDGKSGEREWKIDVRMEDNGGRRSDEEIWRSLGGYSIKGRWLQAAVEIAG